jgi:iron(II)-dependent oxidoreductase
MAPQSVEAIYLDRYATTNADFERFVKAGGYNQEQLWPTEILPSVLQFVDTTGHPGPRFWSSGRAAPDKLDHPVVGVCWYEANAYAHWAGKRLPTAAEWQRAVTWFTPQNKYPWGNVFDPVRANTWIAGPGDTVSVKKYESGCTPNGIYQLIGNVWEWVACCFECGDHERFRVLFDAPMG